MADRTLTINHADGGSETYTINRDKFAGVRDMVVDGANVSVDRTAVPKEQSKETTFGGSQSITVNRDIEPLLSKVVGGAAAAYSLRDLNDSQGNNNVVRGRRESDNSEKDFKAKEVSNGTMARWVNEQPTLPLDLRELDTNTGERDGALIEATAAYSLRNLSSSFTGDVVEVRRSSDGSTQRFTASQIDSGAMLDFVKKPGAFTNSGFETFANNDTGDGFTVTNTATTGFARSSSITGVLNDVVTIDFDLTIISGSPSISLRSTTAPKSNLVSYSTSGSKTAVLTATGAFDNFTFSEGDIPSEFTVSNVRVSTNDGRVRTWYDQSGSDNHAVQTDPTKQPKIVEGGTLFTRGGASEPSILFGGGADNHFNVNGRPSAKSVFSTLQASDNNFETLICDTTDNSPRLTTFNNANNRVYVFDGFGTPSVNVDGATYNGTSSVPSLGFHLLSITSGTGGEVNRIGANSSASSTGNSFNYVSELIIYNSDQSDNRTAIEANIGETYGITDIPAADDTVNGYVQTWYDQSGSVPANDAVQTTAANQPKIVGEVTSGQPHEFLGALVFDGTDDYLDLTTNLTAQPYSTFSVYSATQNASFIYSGGVLPAAGRRSNGQYVTHHGTLLAGGTHPSTEILGTYFANGASSEVFSNGTSVLSGDAGNTANTVAYVFGRPATAFGGTAKELIIYNSDQSSNRPAIETNIANQYGITLS